MTTSKPKKPAARRPTSNASDAPVQLPVLVNPFAARAEAGVLRCLRNEKLLKAWASEPMPRISPARATLTGPLLPLPSEVFEQILAKTEKMVAQCLKMSKVKPTDAQQWRLQRMMRNRLRQLSERPVLDFGLLRNNHAAICPVLASAGGLLLASDAGAPLILANTRAPGNPLGVAGTIAYVVDVILELISTLLSIAGVVIALEGAAAKWLGEAIEKILSTTGGRNLFKALFKALAEGDWKKVGELLEELDIVSLTYQFSTHACANLSWVDFALALASFFGTIAAMAFPATWPLKLIPVAADMIGLGVKLSHAGEYF